MLQCEQDNSDQIELATIDPPSYYAAQTLPSDLDGSMNCMFRDIFGVPSMRAHFQILLLPQWRTPKWLNTRNIVTLDLPNNVKTLLLKIWRLQNARSLGLRGSDDFMDSFLRILNFDDYPCLTYVQYDFLSYIGCPSRIHRKIMVTARNYKKMIIFDGLAMESANYSNKWREKIILDELSDSMRKIVVKYRGIRNPFSMYAIRVIGTQFTFYRAIADEKYVEEACRSPPIKCSPIFQRHPPVKDSMYLNAYDFCNIGDRKEILMSMAAIHRFLTNA